MKDLPTKEENEKLFLSQIYSIYQHEHLKIFNFLQNKIVIVYGRFLLKTLTYTRTPTYIEMFYRFEYTKKSTLFYNLHKKIETEF